MAGDPFEPALAAAAAGMAEPDALVELDELVRRDLVRAQDARRFRFRHPLVRHAVYESAGRGFASPRTSAPRMRSNARERNRWLAPSTSPSRHKSATRSRGAARRAAMRPPPAPVAAHWLGEALRLLPDGPAGRRLDLLVARARALVSAGRLQLALEALGDAIAFAPDEAPALRASLIAQCARVDALLGRPAQARARLLRALEALPERDSGAAGALHVELAIIALGSARTGDVLAHSAAAAASARSSGDVALEATAEALCAFGEMGQGNGARAVAAMARGGKLLDGLADEALAAGLDAAVCLGHVAYHLDRFDDALRWLERGLAVARRTGQGAVLTPLLGGQARVLATLGRLAAADDCADAAWETARWGAQGVARTWTLRDRCHVSLLQGNMPAAARAADEFVALVRRLGYERTGAGAGWLAGQVLLDAGHPARAAAVVLELGGGNDQRLAYSSERCAGYEILARAALAADRIDEASQWATRAEAVARGLPDGRATSVACRTRAYVLLASGDPCGAAAVGLQAVAHAHAVGARIEAARAQVLAGRALAAAGDHESAIAELQRAEAELTCCGARRLRDEAAHELRALGQRVAHLGSRPRDDGALSALTRRELEVAQLVASGRANKEIAATLHLSVSTIESHLRRIFAKLGVRNRTSVAAVVERQRHAPPPEQLSSTGRSA